MSEYDIFTQLAFNWLIVAYFFLGGLSAGSFIFSVFATYLKKEFKPFATTAALIAPVFVVIGMFFLLLDLGQPFRMWRLFFHFTPTSAVSWGTWFLNIYFALSLGYAWLLLFGDEAKAKKIAYLGVPFALIVGSYTGVLLTQMTGKALWHSALLPVLFLNGGLISGLSLVMLISAGRSEQDLLSKLGKIISVLILLELGMIIFEIIALLNGGTESVAAAKFLLQGPYSFIFWVFEIVLGAIIPIMLLFRNKITGSARVLAALLILIGIYTMRYIIVIGGQTL